MPPPWPPTPADKGSAATLPFVTPSPASSAGPSSSRPLMRTPLDRSVSRDLLASVRHAASASGGHRKMTANAPTPHTRAARLALNQRRNALFTPGKKSRRSVREQRETPMDILRTLGRALAPGSKPVLPSSPEDQEPNIAPIPTDDDDDELPIDRPRLSLPLDQDDDAGFHPPRSSGLEEENFTVQSIELPRRAYSEQAGAGLARASLGISRVSDFNQNDHDLPSETNHHSDFFPGLLEDLQARTTADDFTLDRIEMDATRRITAGAESDFGLERPAGIDDTTTFLLSDPPAPRADPEVDTAMMNLTSVEDEATQHHDMNSDTLFFDDIGAPNTDFGRVDSVSVHEEADKPRTKAPTARKRQKRLSRHSVEYPPLPPLFVKRLAQTALQSSGLSNPRISADTLAALTQASDWFFDQLGDDLEAYAKHAKRKTIEESDVVTLMRRSVTPSARVLLQLTRAQTTPNWIWRLHLLPGAETSTSRIAAGAENARAPAEIETLRQACSCR